MGGTFIQLVDHGHEVHVVYQTSGNIAVFDEDASRFIDFINDFNEVFDLQKEATHAMYKAINKHIKSKKPDR
ncbi:MAG: hypothetical protein R2788_16950 [Saprospiraceae bacterium]